MPPPRSPWDEDSETIRLFGDKLVELRWARWVATDNRGLFFALTPLGRRKLGALRALMRELGYQSWTRAHAVAFFAFLDIL